MNISIHNNSVLIDAFFYKFWMSLEEFNKFNIEIQYSLARLTI